MKKKTDSLMQKAPTDTCLLDVGHDNVNFKINDKKMGRHSFNVPIMSSDISVSHTGSSFCITMPMNDFEVASPKWFEIEHLLHRYILEARMHGFTGRLHLGTINVTLELDDLYSTRSSYPVSTLAGKRILEIGGEIVYKGA